MRRRRSNSGNTVFLLVVLLIIGIGIAYAVLTETLTINNTVSYDAMKWDVGFTSAEDGVDPYIDALIKYAEKTEGITLEEMGMTRDDFKEGFFADIVLATPTPVISSDKKSITVNCELQKTSKSQDCLVKATITNYSTFNVAFSDTPEIIYDDKYIRDAEITWLNHDLYGFVAPLSVGQTLAPNESVDVWFYITTQELSKDMLPAIEIDVPVTMKLNFKEVDYLVKDLAMLVSENYNRAFWTNDYKQNIKNIAFEDAISIPDNAVQSWDLSLSNDGRIMSYIVFNENDSTFYDLHIQSNQPIYANFDMSNWFEGFSNVDSINGLELVDTSLTTNMEYMFWYTGQNSDVFTLDVSNFDTSKVTDMHGMF